VLQVGVAVVLQYILLTRVFAPRHFADPVVLLMTIKLLLVIVFVLYFEPDCLGCFLHLRIRSGSQDSF
jgi:hypothetical protein